MGEVTVCAATAEDDAALAALFAAYHKEFEYSLGEQDVAGEGRQARAYYQDGGVLVAKQGGAVVGCVAFEPWGPGRCRMKRMVVALEARGQGIGRALAEAVLATAKDAGFARMCLDTTARMKAATSLYRSLGFEPFIPDYTAPCREVQYMQRGL